jgi:signal transduction histidine kinase
MRIQTRIFLMLSLLVLAVVGVQVWLHYRQMKAVERSLGSVATSIGRDMLTRRLEVVERLGMGRETTGAADEDRSEEAIGKHKVMVHKVVSGNVGGTGTILHWSGASDGDDGPLSEEEIEVIIRTDIEEADGVGVFVNNQEDDIAEDSSVMTKVIRLEVDDERPQMMMIFEDGGDVTEIEIPTSETMDIFHKTFRTSLMAAGLLLVVGLGASALVSRRLARPLQDLARRAEQVGSGEVGLRVPVTSSGEIGELEAAFDRMSVRLQELETEREEWRRREHLAQLGDLSRGLAHTVRNPLHTLGLAVEELAGEGDDPRVTTARSEIRRIDRWIRSFLALGAGDAASVERCDLVELVEEALLEAGRQGVDLRFAAPRDPIIVDVVPTGLRAAVGNLLENAVQASDEASAVDVVLSSDGAHACIEIRDRGPGLPEAIRQRLFEPHQTNRPGGAGMGLFLAKQLIEEMHGGTLALLDAEGGGTLVRIELPLSTHQVPRDTVMPDPCTLES